MIRARKRWFLVPSAIIAAGVLAVHCATPTALTVTIYSEVPCTSDAVVAFVGASTLADLPAKAPAAVSTQCSDDGRMGSIVVVPAGSKSESVAIAVMQRPDGQPADACLQSPSGCIVAKREYTFEKHDSADMRIDLRLSCLNVTCDTNQTCVEGTCINAIASCTTSCDETTLIQQDDAGALIDAGTTTDASTVAPPRDAGVDATVIPGLTLLEISPGTLSPSFAQSTLNYTVGASVASIGSPFTITPTYAGGTLTINNVAVASGTPSGVIPLSLTQPTVVDVVMTITGGAPTTYKITIPPQQEAYVKPGKAAAAYFGTGVAISGDTLVVGAPGEAVSGVAGAGGAYIFNRTGTTWAQTAHLTPPSPTANAQFGASVAIDGQRVVVGSPGESTGAANSGGAYVFVNSGSSWTQQALLKASNASFNSTFGGEVAISGTTIVVTAYGESGSGTGVTAGAPTTVGTGASQAGAAYVFVQNPTTSAWSQQAYVKASNTSAGAGFGTAVAIDGDTFAVAAYADSSIASGVNDLAQQDMFDASSAGYSSAVYVFVRNGTTWTQQAFIKAPVIYKSEGFGAKLGLAGDTLVSGTCNEISTTTGINPPMTGNAGGTGAVYVYGRDASTWTQDTFIKPAYAQPGESFGWSVSLSPLGDRLAVGAYQEASNAVGINGTPSDTSMKASGAAYVFNRTNGVWSQQAYVKPSNTSAGAQYGFFLSVSEDTLAVGSPDETSTSTGINGSETVVLGDAAAPVGAVYILR